MVNFFTDVIELNRVRLPKSKYFMKMNKCNITRGDVGHEIVSYDNLLTVKTDETVKLFRSFLFKTISKLFLA